MKYSLLIYDNGLFEDMSPGEQEKILQAHRDLQAELAAKGDLVVAKLMPVAHAVTVLPENDKDSGPLIVDGPYSETKERFMGFYVADFSDAEAAITAAKKLSAPGHKIEVRPVEWSGEQLTGKD